MEALSRGGADDAQPRHLRQRLGGVLQQLVLVSGHGGAVQRVQVVHRRAPGRRRRRCWGCRPRTCGVRRPRCCPRSSRCGSSRRRPGTAPWRRAAPGAPTARRCPWAHRSCGRRRRRSRSPGPARPPGSAAPPGRRPAAPARRRRGRRATISPDRVDGAQRVGDVGHGHQPGRRAEHGLVMRPCPARRRRRPGSPSGRRRSARTAAARGRCWSGAPWWR